MSKEKEEQFQKFIDILIADLGLADLPKEKKQEVVERISNIAQHRIIQTILLCAKEEDVKGIEEEIEKAEKPEDVYVALADKIEGLDKKIEESLSELYLNLKESVEKTKEE